MTSLPKLTQRHSPNQSARLGGTPHLIVVHRPVSSFAAAESWLCNPRAQASAHLITDSDRRAVQLVPWDRKAWACEAFNSASYNLEVDDNAWNGSDHAALETAARIVAYLCHKTNIPPVWTRQPTHLPGVCRHYDLGIAGGGHTDPTTDDRLWRRFLVHVQRELAAGGFRRSYGVGRLRRI